METVIASWILVFMIYSFAGWVMEFLVTWVQFRKWINRGFLVGPVCPIYGTGVVILSTLTHGLTNPFAIFFAWLIGGSVIEYLASYLMERMFCVRWWDYKKNRFNINGRICLWSALTFGIGGVIVMKLVNPRIFALLGSLPVSVITAIAAIFSVLLAADICLSLWLMLGVRVTVGTVQRDATEEISERVREILMEKGKLNRRLVKAFPNQTPSKKPVRRTKTKTKA